VYQNVQEKNSQNFFIIIFSELKWKDDQHKCWGCFELC